MYRRFFTIVVLVALLFGCKNQASPTSIPDGVTQITKNMRGIWDAPGGPGCKWRIVIKSASGKKTTVSSGGGNKSQTVIIGSSHVGGEFRSDKCAPKGWTQ
jgi:hypothetical protein